MQQILYLDCLHFKLASFDASTYEPINQIKEAKYLQKKSQKEYLLRQSKFSNFLKELKCGKCETKWKPAFYGLIAGVGVFFILASKYRQSFLRRNLASTLPSLSCGLHLLLLLSSSFQALKNQQKSKMQWFSTEEAASRKCNLMLEILL